MKPESIGKMISEEIVECLFQMATANDANFAFYQGRMIEAFNIASKIGFVYPKTMDDFKACLSVHLQESNEETTHE